jgi:hypothetical protein
MGPAQMLTPAAPPSTNMKSPPQKRELPAQIGNRTRSVQRGQSIWSRPTDDPACLLAKLTLEPGVPYARALCWRTNRLCGGSARVATTGRVVTQNVR